MVSREVANHVHGQVGRLVDTEDYRWLGGRTEDKRIRRWVGR